jgi:hypothetical protein
MFIYSFMQEDLYTATILGLGHVDLKQASMELTYK